jgi:hypothetical protein
MRVSMSVLAAAALLVCADSAGANGASPIAQGAPGAVPPKVVISLDSKGVCRKNNVVVAVSLCNRYACRRPASGKIVCNVAPTAG